MTRNVAAIVRLMLVTDDALVAPDRVVRVCQAAARGGVTSVQLRYKHLPARELVALARELIAALSIPVLVNDRLDVALAAGALGVHLGPEDLPVALARRIAPPGFLIGASVGSPVETVLGEGADYWGVGPWRETGTKPNAGAALGEAGFQRIVAAARGIPSVAIGGIQPEDTGSVHRLGGAGVAVVSGILADDDVEAAARRYALAAAILS